jgi:ribosomal protein S6--L-glutamate ligase
MKFGILTLTPDNYSTTRLVEEIKAKGHTFEIINYLHADMKIYPDQADVLYDGRSLSDIDVIIPRIGAKDTFYGMALVRQFEMLRKYCLNGSIGISRAKDKLRTMQIMVRKGIPIPNTFFSHKTDDSEKIVDSMGGAPLIIKLIEGLQGIGVVLAESKTAAISVIEAFGGMRANIILQEFVKEANGEDKRLLVLGDKVIASMKRKASPGEFRSNLHRGGSSEAIKISPVEREIAVKAAKELRLNFAGVDIISSNSGPKVLEINSSPGLEGIEGSTKKNLAGQVIEYIEKNFEEGHRKIHKATL